MKLRNLVSVAAIAAAMLFTFSAPSFAQEEEDEPTLENEPVLQGGFHYVNKRTKKEGDFDLNNMTTLSDGPEILSGGRIRALGPGFINAVCYDIVWFEAGAAKVDRSDKKLKVKQKDLVEITFALFDCPGDTPTCLILQSNTVPSSKCSATTKTNAKDTLKKGLPPVGKSKFQCKDGIEVTSPEFGLGEGVQGTLLELFPDIRDKVKSNFSDDAGVILDDDDALDELSPDLGLPSCF